MNKRPFHGWRMVAACHAIAIISWSLGVYGNSVYLYALTSTHGWPLTLIASAVTLFYLVGALSSMPVGAMIERRGPRPVIIVGATGLAAGIALLGAVREPWQVYLAFPMMGIGYACLSTVALSATLAPWFERHQGRAVSLALIGASIAGIVSAPLLIGVINWLGFAIASRVFGLTVLVTLLPIAWWVLKRRPEDLGQLPDGTAPDGRTDMAPPARPELPPAVGSAGAPAHYRWRRRDALRTPALQSVILAFGLALLVQVGVLTHHVTMLTTGLGQAQAAALVSATGIAALLGRVALATWADRVDMRQVAAGVFGLAAVSLAVLAVLIDRPDSAGALIIATVVYGLSVGNVTTMSPIIIRREWGALSFGSIYGAASLFIGLSLTTAPAVFGLLHDLGGGYALPIWFSAAADGLAALIILRGRRRGMVSAG